MTNFARNVMTALLYLHCALHYNHVTQQQCMKFNLQKKVSFQSVADQRIATHTWAVDNQTLVQT